MTASTDHRCDLPKKEVSKMNWVLSPSLLFASSRAHANCGTHCKPDQGMNVQNCSCLHLQGSANPRTPGSEKMRMKSCVLLPAAGRKTQLFILIFSEPGVRGLADPCRCSAFKRSLFALSVEMEGCAVMAHKGELIVAIKC